VTVTAATASVTVTQTMTVSALSTITAGSENSGNSTSSVSSESSCPKSHDVAIGAGLGAPLGLALLTIAFLLWKLRQKPQQQHYSYDPVPRPPVEAPCTKEPMHSPPQAELGGNPKYINQGRFGEVAELGNHT
jgi:hypothetical protein